MSEEKIKESSKRPKFDSAKCEGCGACVIGCPNDCIETVPRPEDDPNARKSTMIVSLDLTDCIGCGNCAKRCSEEAITMLGGE